MVPAPSIAIARAAGPHAGKVMAAGVNLCSLSVLTPPPAGQVWKKSIFAGGQRATASDFRGDTFRVLKEKEKRDLKIKKHLTRRLVLETWEERLSAVGWADSGGTAPLPQVDLRPEPAVKIKSQPVVEPIREEPKPVKLDETENEEGKTEPLIQPTLY